ncbi:MAG: D-alanyl-D-alanine carboxypeptidase family protein [Acetobacterales bacterium]
MTSLIAPAARRTAALALALLLLGTGHAAVAQEMSTPAKQAILMDAETGAVLFEKNPDQRTGPASMSKLMTLYLLFDRLKRGDLSLEDRFLVSEKAWRKGGSKMFVEVGDRVSVEDLIRGIVVHSGNDATIVVAEGLAGSEEAFAAEMTARAHEIGMTNSHFVNASGWPDPEQYVTARDLATLALRLIQDFPAYYHYFAEIEFTYSDIRQGNRNPLLYRDLGVDGLKTGHTEEAGFGLAASAERNGQRLMLVVHGLDGMKSRSQESERLLDWGFRTFKNYKLFTTGEAVDQAQVWLGQEPRVPLLVPRDLTVTMKRKSRSEMQARIVYQGPVPAPVVAGDRIGSLVVSAPDFETVEIPLVAGNGVERLGVFGRFGAALHYLVFGASG